MAYTVSVDAVAESVFINSWKIFGKKINYALNAFSACVDLQILCVLKSISTVENICQSQLVKLLSLVLSLTEKFSSYQHVKQEVVLLAVKAFVKRHDAIPV